MLRGALLATYNFWFGVGQFAGAIALQVATGLVGYKQPIYAQWVFIGVMVPVWFIIPETPCEWHPLQEGYAAVVGLTDIGYYINKNQPEKAKRSMRYLNGSIKGYDVDLEYRVLNYERELQERMAQEAASAGYKELFKGSNA
jgi:hypothetical protein